MRSLNIIFINY